LAVPAQVARVWQVETLVSRVSGLAKFDQIAEGGGKGKAFGEPERRRTRSLVHLGNHHRIHCHDSFIRS